jgi:hypothetical protein
MPGPSLAGVARVEGGTRYVHREIRIARITQFGNEEHSSEEVVGITGIRYEMGLDCGKTSCVHGYRPILTDSDETIGGRQAISLRNLLSAGYRYYNRGNCNEKADCIPQHGARDDAHR